MVQGTSEVSIFGMPVSVFDSYADAVQFVRERVASRQQTLCIALNPPKMFRARREPVLLRTLNAAHMRICDGVGVSWAALLLHRRWVPRVTGIQLFLDLIEVAADEGWKVFLLGASAQSNAAARAKLLETHPGLQIVGSRDGFFEDSREVVQAINQSGADLLFVAMGSPRQEFWMSEHMQRLNTVLCMGIGGSLDAISGAAKWAPALFRATGTEWLFRIVTQPRLLGRFKLALLFGWDVLRAMPLFARPAQASQSEENGWRPS